jgi:hypothetical protein
MPAHAAIKIGAMARAGTKIACRLVERARSTSLVRAIDMIIFCPVLSQCQEAFEHAEQPGLLAPDDRWLMISTKGRSRVLTRMTVCQDYAGRRPARKKTLPRDDLLTDAERDSLWVKQTHHRHTLS